MLTEVLVSGKGVVEGFSLLSLGECVVRARFVVSTCCSRVMVRLSESVIFGIGFSLSINLMRGKALDRDGEGGGSGGGLIPPRN